MRATNAVRREAIDLAPRASAAFGVRTTLQIDRHVAAVGRLAIAEPQPGAAHPGDTCPTITKLAPQWVQAYARAEAVDRRRAEVLAKAEELYPPHPCPVWNRNEPAAAHPAREHWEAQVAAIDRAFGLPPIDKASDQAFKLAEGISEQILVLRPRDVREAAMKFGVIMRRVDDGKGGVDDPRPIHAFMTDLERLAEEERAAE